MPTLKQLRTLITLSRAGSFTTAAEELALTQSAVSIMIRDLEAELTVPLVLRGRTVRLTEAGQALCDTGGRAIRDLERTCAAIKEGRELSEGRIRVAVAPMTAATFFPRALALFRVSHPQFGVEVFDVPVEQASQKLLADDVDVAIGSIGANPTYASTLTSDLLLADRVYAVFASGHAPTMPAVQGRRMSWSALHNMEVILTGRIDGQWREFLLQLNRAGVAVNVSQEVVLYSTCLEMVRCGLGMTLLPGFAARRLDPAHYDVRGLQHGSSRWEVQWMTRTGHTITPAMRALKQATIEALATA